MATQTTKREIIIDLTVENSEAVNSIVKAREQLTQLQVEMLKLNGARKAGTITNEEYEKSFVQLTTAMNDCKNVIKANQKVLDDAVKAHKGAGDSLNNMRAEVRNLVNDYNNLSKAERDSAKGTELLDKINGLKDQIRSADFAMQDYRINVGNYMSAMGGIPGAVGGALNWFKKLSAGTNSMGAAFKNGITVIKAFGKELWALMTNPIVAAIAAIVAVVMKLVDQFKKSDDAMTALQDAFASFEPVLEVINRLFASLVDILAWVLKGITSVVTAVLSIIPSFRAAEDEAHAMVMALDELQDAERQYAVESEKRQIEINKLRNISVQADKYTVEERKKALEQAIELEKQNLKEQLEIAETKMNLRKHEAEVEHDTSDATKNEIADLEAAYYKAIADYEAGQRRVLKQLDTFNKELKKTAEEAQKSWTKMYQNNWKAIMSDESKGYKERKKAAKDYLDSVVEQARQEYQAIAGLQTASDDEKAKALADYTDTVNSARTEYRNFVKGLTKDAVNARKERNTRLAELEKELQDLILANMADGLEKEVKQIQSGSDEAVRKLKQAMETDKKNRELYQAIIIEKERQTAQTISKLREDAYKTILGDSEKIAKSYSALWQSFAPDSFTDFVRNFEAITTETSKEIEEINRQIEEMRKNVEQLEKTSQDPLNDNKVIEAKKELAKAEEKYITAVQKSTVINRRQNEAMEQYAKTIQDVMLNEAKLGKMTEVPEKFTVYVDYQIELDRKKMTELRSELEKLAEAGKLDSERAKEIKQMLNDTDRHLSQQIMIKKGLSEMGDIERRMLDIQRGNLGFFDNAELMENLLQIKQLNNQIEVVKKTIERGGKLEQELKFADADTNRLLQERINLTDKISKARQKENEIAEKERQAQEAFDNGNTEDAERMYSELERMELEYREFMDGEYLQAKENRLKETDEAIEINAGLIESLKEEMAAMGYTTEEQMQAVLGGLLSQEEMYAKQTKRIFANTAQSVLQSVSSVVGALSDLMNEVGEDNADMVNFLEGIAYVQIGVNMAAGIAEAIAAGAGMPFPYNLAAIAAGVAAVVAGIANAISVYKQYHKNVSSPKFSEGGYVDGPGTETSDSIQARLSNGEYVIKASKVREYGRGFFDRLNGSKGSNGFLYADGGAVSSQTATQASSNEWISESIAEAFAAMPSPVVSVKEITKVQDRVRVKSRIAAQ